MLEDAIGIQRRMAFIIQKREEIWTGLKKELPVDIRMSRGSMRNCMTLSTG